LPWNNETRHAYEFSAMTHKICFTSKRNEKISVFSDYYYYYCCCCFLHVLVSAPLKVMSPSLPYVWELLRYKVSNKRWKTGIYITKCRVHKTCVSTVAGNVSGHVGRSVGSQSKALVIPHAQWCGIVWSAFSTSPVSLVLVD
jgi:hypothetical protein